MINIGAHLSISKGYASACKTANSIGANTFQYFPRNPRGGKAKSLDTKDVDSFINLVKEYNFAPILCHAPYTYNLCSAKEEVRQFAKNAMKEDLERLELLPVHLYNFHPGSHVGQGVEIGINKIVEILNDVVTDDITSCVLLETMAGKGTEIGRSFDEINDIINRVKFKEKLGVCLDTCHVFCAGYDIVNDIDGVLNEFDKIIGIDKLKAIHLNDSMMPFGSNKDRHAEIGKGLIGKDALIKILTHPSLKDIPFFLETPLDNDGHKDEIKYIKNLINN